MFHAVFGFVFALLVFAALAFGLYVLTVFMIFATSDI